MSTLTQKIQELQLLEKAKPCPMCKETSYRYCRMVFVRTEDPLPKNIRIGCAKHNYYMNEIFSSPEEAVEAWNKYDATKRPELKTCPFCGSEAELSYNNAKGVQITCSNKKCLLHNLEIDGFTTEAEAAEKWNKRPGK